MGSIDLVGEKSSPSTAHQDDHPVAEGEQPKSKAPVRRRRAANARTGQVHTKKRSSASVIDISPEQDAANGHDSVPTGEGEEPVVAADEHISAARKRSSKKTKFYSDDDYVKPTRQAVSRKKVAVVEVPVNESLAENVPPGPDAVLSPVTVVAPKPPLPMGCKSITQYTVEPRGEGKPSSQAPRPSIHISQPPPPKPQYELSQDTMEKISRHKERAQTICDELIALEM
jgi:hypothetical protein